MDRTIRDETMVDAPVKETWDAWTRTEGVTTFFAPHAHVELRTGGAYEMYFMPDAPEGSRGSEGCTILGFDPDRSLAFTWNFPPHIPIHDQRTTVKIRFHPLEEERTRVAIEHSGWKEGAAWDEGYRYFQRAWRIVLGRLQFRFQQGPIDWEAPYTPENP